MHFTHALTMLPVAPLPLLAQVTPYGHTVVLGPDKGSEHQALGSIAAVCSTRMHPHSASWHEVAADEARLLFVYPYVLLT